MRFSMPNFPCEFEIPDEWLMEAQIQSFATTASAYRSHTDAQLVALCENPSTGAAQYNAEGLARL
jgi:hypothetical protein